MNQKQNNMNAEEIEKHFENNCIRYGFRDGDKEFYKKSEVIKAALSLLVEQDIKESTLNGTKTNAVNK